MESIPAEHARIDLASSLVILEQHRLRRQNLADLLERGRRRALKRREFLVGAANRVQRLAQSVFEQLRLLAKRLDPPLRPLLALDQLLLHLPIVQVDLLAEAAHIVAEIALDARRQRTGAERDQVGETARLC